MPRFDLHAGLVTRAGQRDQLERLCRYATGADRLHVSAEGTIWLALRAPRADGTTHLRFAPLEVPERLAVLTPRPRVNPILDYGVLARRPAWRGVLIPRTSHGVDTSHVEPPAEADEETSRPGPSGPVRISGPS